MTTVCSTFLFVSPQAFGRFLPATVGYGLGAAALVTACVWFLMWYRRSIAEQ